MSLSTTCTSPKYRLLLNGLLLGVGWTAALTGYARIGATLLIVVSAIAGWGIAVRAWNALRVRHVSIELLITIAAAGALIIGEYIEAAAVTFRQNVGARTFNQTEGVVVLAAKVHARMAGNTHFVDKQAQPRHFMVVERFFAQEELFHA